MLHFITGANGAGKTLNTLKWVRERQLKENRPVCHNGRFEPVEGGELDNWKKIDFKDWQNEPDGTIFLIDECHNDLPLRPPSGLPPEEVRMLAEHRRRGFDFYLVTQHPQNVDSFVRRLVGSPGWHRHLKRVWGSDLVSCLEWDSINPNCEKAGAAKNAKVTTYAFPKDVYKWYRSASLHTGKKSIPKMFWVLLAAIVVVLFTSFFGIKMLRGQYGNPETKPATPSTLSPVPAGIGTREGRVLTAAEYVAERSPRLKDFSHTAPAYDGVTRPTEAPYPAACVHMGKACKCYTQQATLLQVSEPVCLQIVRQGFFMDWKTKEQGPTPQQQSPLQPHQQASAQLVQSLPMPMPAAKPDPQQNVYLQGLAARNAQVRSSLTQ